MKNKKRFIITAIIIAIILFVIPIRSEEGVEWIFEGTQPHTIWEPYTIPITNYYNIYGIKIWQKK